MLEHVLYCELQVKNEVSSFQRNVTCCFANTKGAIKHVYKCYTQKQVLKSHDL